MTLAKWSSCNNVYFAANQRSPGWFVGEFSSILASLLGFLPSLDQLVRSGESTIYGGLMPGAVSDEANEAGRKTSSSFFYLANGLFYKAHRLPTIIAVGDVNEAKADREPMSLYEIENNIHRIITDILARLVGRFPLLA